MRVLYKKAPPPNRVESDARVSTNAVACTTRICQDGMVNAAAQPVHNAVESKAERERRMQRAREKKWRQVHADEYRKKSRERMRAYRAIRKLAKLSSADKLAK